MRLSHLTYFDRKLVLTMGSTSHIPRILSGKVQAVVRERRQCQHTRRIAELLPLCHSVCSIEWRVLQSSRYANCVLGFQRITKLLLEVCRSRQHSNSKTWNVYFR